MLYNINKYLKLNLVKKINVYSQDKLYKNYINFIPINSLKIKNTFNIFKFQKLINFYFYLITNNVSIYYFFSGKYKKIQNFLNLNSLSTNYKLVFINNINLTKTNITMFKNLNIPIINFLSKHFISNNFEYTIQLNKSYAEIEYFFIHLFFLIYVKQKKNSVKLIKKKYILTNFNRILKNILI